MDKKTIGIIGGGFVGAVLKRYYEDAKVYDIKPELSTHNLREVLKSQIIFMAVNLLDNCRSEESKKKMDDYFAAMDPGTIVINKATWVPGTLDYFQNLHQHLHFVCNPEFLTELSAWDDFTEPDLQILGVPYQSIHLIHEIFKLLPEAPVKRVISPIDAETLKHAFNTYYSTKVIFFNQLYDSCQKLGSDYETVREIMIQDPRVGDSHSIIFHKGSRGFGGKCLPKEVDNWTKICSSPLIEKVKEINDKLRSDGKNKK